MKKSELKYQEQIEAFNKACGASYYTECHFLTFRKTRKGILVGYTCGKRNEINELCADIRRAGAPYYRNWN